MNNEEVVDLESVDTNLDVESIQDNNTWKDPSEEAYRRALELVFTFVQPYLEDAFHVVTKDAYVACKKDSNEQPPDRQSVCIDVLDKAHRRLSVLPPRNTRYPYMTREELLGISLDDDSDDALPTKRTTSPNVGTTPTAQQRRNAVDLSDDDSSSVQSANINDIRVNTEKIFRNVKRDIARLPPQDRMKLLNESMSCPVCFKSYTTTTSKPQDEKLVTVHNLEITSGMWSLKCGHILCYTCLWNWYKRTKTMPRKGKNLSCPMCNMLQNWSDCRKIYMEG